MDEPFSGDLEFTYLKSSSFRVIHVDGVHGGIRPAADTIHMTLFSERLPIPKKEVYRIEDGKLGPVVRADKLTGVVRELEVAAVMSLSTARALRTWLDTVIQGVEALSQGSKSE